MLGNVRDTWDVHLHYMRKGFLGQIRLESLEIKLVSYTTTQNLVFNILPYTVTFPKRDESPFPKAVEPKGHFF